MVNLRVGYPRRVKDALTRKQRAGATAPHDTPAPQAAPRALRLHRRGRPTGAVLLDETEPYTIGRGAQADLCFDDDGVSRVHAHLKHEDVGWVLVDARSANGTFVAGAGDASDDTARARLFSSARALVPGTPRVLAVGDVVFLGDAHAALEAVDDVALPHTTPLPPGPHESARGRAYAQAIARAARARGPVLLIGKSGSGKTWAARALHDASGRSGRFLALNAAALPHDPTQLRSVLLGHTKGAFTGATADVEGAWLLADGGTLFLDEVDSLAPPAQAFLLTLLEQSGDLAPLGAPARGERARGADVRVVTASKTALADAKLREDLAYRLADGAIVQIPSLEERREDIPSLVRALLEELAREDGAVAAFDDDAYAACARARWPGEIRQLRGVVRLLAREALADGRQTVRAADVDAQIAALERALGSRIPEPASAPFSSSRAGPAPKKARQLTKEDLARALADADGNMQHAADALGVARNTLLTKMETFGIPRPSKRG
jgi:DNA-binding NtrC family response regulator